MGRRILLFCGTLSSLLYAFTLVFVPSRWEAYSSFSQTVSELSAIGAPTRTLWNALIIPYGFLLLAFALGVWRAAGRNRSLRVVAALLLIDGIAGFFWPPMHLREALAGGQGSLTDTLHIAFTMLWALLVLLAMGFAAAAFGRWFRLYTLVSVVVLITFGVLTGASSDRIGANLPTPWAGVWERINIGAYLLWMVTLSLVLMARASDAPSHQSVSPGLTLRSA